jgi:Predicted symporter
MIHLTTLDYVTIGVYFAITAVIGIVVARGDTDSDDLFLAGRSLGPLAIGFSLYAANVSSDTLIGLPGAAYSTGISVANYEWMAGVVLIFTALFVLPVLSRSRVTTLPELMESASIRGCVYLRHHAVPVGGAGHRELDLRRFGGGHHLHPEPVAVGDVGHPRRLHRDLHRGGRSARGGLHRHDAGGRAARRFDRARADRVRQVRFSWAQVTQRIDPDKLHLLEPIGGPGIPWLGTLIGLPVAGFYYWTMNQYVVQRVLGARNIQAAGRAAIIASGMKLLNLFFMVLPGAMAVALLPHLQHADSVYPEMVRRFAPPGLTGLIIAGLLAALMSSVSAILNSSATLVTVDFIAPRRPELTSSQLAWIGRGLTIVIAILAALWAPMIRDFKGLFAYMQQLFAYVASPLVAVFLIGLWDRRLGAGAALRGLITGHVFSAAAFVLGKTGLIHIHFTIMAGIVCAATALFTYGWMLLLGRADRPAPEDARIALIARAGLERVPRDVMIGAAVVITLIVAMLVVFR